MRWSALNTCGLLAYVMPYPRVAIIIIIIIAWLYIASLHIRSCGYVYCTCVPPKTTLYQSLLFLIAIVLGIWSRVHYYIKPVPSATNRINRHTYRWMDGQKITKWWLTLGLCFAVRVNNTQTLWITCSVEAVKCYIIIINALSYTLSFTILWPYHACMIIQHLYLKEQSLGCL